MSHSLLGSYFCHQGLGAQHGSVISLSKARQGRAAVEQGLQHISMQSSHFVCAFGHLNSLLLFKRTGRFGTSVNVFSNYLYKLPD